MQYLTYEEYSQKGGTLDLTAFNRNIDRACGIVKNATHGRIERMESIPEEVKALCRDLVEYLAQNSASSAVVTSRSQSAGAVSESESYATKTADDIQGEIDGIVFDYLGGVYNDCGVPVLYRGCKF